MYLTRPLANIHSLLGRRHIIGLGSRQTLWDSAVVGFLLIIAFHGTDIAVSLLSRFCELAFLVLLV